MRDYEKRFTRLQERMLKEVKDLREETNKRFDSFESYMAKELESLSDRLKTEKNARAESVKGLSRELKDTFKSSDKKTSQLDDQLSKISRELRQQILDQSKTLSGEIRQKQEETSAMVDEAARELRVEKVDRSTLSQLLTEVALRLNDELAMKLNLESKGLGDE
jgi:hypothetical protein